MFSVDYRWIFGGILILLAILAAVGQIDMAAAQSPQEGRPAFEVTGQSAPDGSVVIQAQEARLDQAYFEAHGEPDGLEVTAAGLTLGEGRTEGVYVSGVIESPLALTTDIVPLWQATLPDGTELRLETRLRLEGGAWSDWVENPEAFYPVRDDQHGGSLIWVGSPQAAVQVRVTLSTGAAGDSPVLQSLILAFNDTSDGPTDGEIAVQMAGRVEGAGSSSDICPSKPAVVPRTEWGCPHGASSPRRPPAYQPVTHVVIHQTETPNRPAPYTDWAGWVRSVWNYHANVLRWGDVGYNYMIDPEGVIYEGRAGGDDVVGVHDRVNKGSMAIGFLGCYGDCDDYRLSVADPSPAMLESAVHLIAWKLGQAGLDPHGKAAYGWRKYVPVIAGGRDVAWTSSPGYRLYHKLPYLRDAVKARIAQCQVGPQSCQISQVEFDKAEYTVNEPVGLSVKVVDQADKPLQGAKVTYDVLLTPTIQSQRPGIDLDLDEVKGVYEGVYVDTQIPGAYLFQITAVDPAGDQYTCFREEVITVKDTTAPPAKCQIDLQATPTFLTPPGAPITFTANVTLENTAVLTAAVLATVVDPAGEAIEVDLPASNDGTYSQMFAETTLTGTYSLTATAAGAGFSCESPLRSFTVEDSVPPPPQECKIDIQAAPVLLTTPGDPITLTANVTLDSASVLTTAAVTATVVDPAGDPVMVGLPSLNDGAYRQVFTGTTLTGTYSLTATAAGEGVSCESPRQTFTVEESSPPLAECQIDLQAEPALLTTPREPITLTANVTLAGAPVSTATVLATVVNPEGASTEVDLPALNAGIYRRPFTGTALLGTYDLSAAAGGEGFACRSPLQTFSVEQSPPMSDTLVSVAPISVTLCQGQEVTATTQIRIDRVTDLQGFDFELAFDPAVVRVVDADPTTAKVEIGRGDTFAGDNLLGVVNEVVTETGRIRYVAGLLQTFSGDGVLAEIEWAPVISGASVLTFSQVNLSDPNGERIAQQVMDGTIVVTTCSTTTVIGRVALEGRQDHSGIVVSDGRSGRSRTDSDGSFSITGPELLTLRFPGYLSAQVDVRGRLAELLSANLLDLGQMMLIAGDVTGDDMIDIFDVAYLGARYASTDPTSDLNGDGVVDIFDLTMAADNYGLQGPVTWSSHQ